MGDRAQVRFIYNNEAKTEIYFYTHWTGYLLAKDVQNAIKRGQDRWNDTEYLARIIFSEMIQRGVLDTCGYGIGVNTHDDLQHDIITVDCNTQKVIVPGFGSWDFKTYAELDESYTEGY